MKRKKGKLGKIILIIAIAAIVAGALNKNDSEKDAGTRSAESTRNIQTETQLKASSSQVIAEDPALKEPAVSSGIPPAEGSPTEPAKAEAAAPGAAGTEGTIAPEAAGTEGTIAPGAAEKEEPAVAPSPEETAPAAETAAPAAEAAADPADAEKDQTTEKRDPDSISPELKDFLDSYEKFMDQYCAFLENYNTADTSQMLRYIELMAQYADFADKADAWNETEMTDAETVYYVETLNRINVKLLKVSQKLN